MSRSVLAALVCGLAFLAPASAQACGYYAIFECARNPNVDGPGYVIDTDSVDGFRAGWYCNVLGPYGSKSKARSLAKADGGYVKYGCQGGGE